MVATIATAASADYYIHSQASHRPVPRTAPTASAPSPAAAPAKPDPATTPTREPAPASDALQEYRAWFERANAELEQRIANWPDPPNRRAPVPEPTPAPEPPPRELTPDELFEDL